MKQLTSQRNNRLQETAHHFIATKIAVSFVIKKFIETDSRVPTGKQVFSRLGYFEVKRIN